MDALRIETMSMDKKQQVQPERARAEKVAGQFEDLFVKTLVSSLRQTATLGGESMFGKGPGADTYAGWFDQNVSEQLGRSGGIGIARTILRDMERHGDIERDVDRLDDARRAADHNTLATARAAITGGTDVVR